MADHRNGLQRALDYIGAHLDQPVRLEDVARAAGLSPYHFHRIFRAAMDETVGQYVTRKRLETAALMLAYQRDLSVTEIAYATGYSSPSNFAKAFSAFFGCSPTAVRTPAEGGSPRVGALTTRYGKDFTPADLYAAPQRGEPDGRVAALERSVRFEAWEDRTLVCMTSPGGYDLEAVNRTWARLIAHARQLGLCGEDVDAYGIAHEDPALTAAAFCRYDACVRVPAPPPALPTPLFVTALPRGRYAVFRYAGPAAAVPGIYRDIYGGWFLCSAVLPDGPPPVEHYVHDGPDAAGNVDMEIAIKVRPSR